MCIKTTTNKKIVSLIRHHHYDAFSWLGECLSMLFPHMPVLRYYLPDGTVLLLV